VRPFAATSSASRFLKLRPCLTLALAALLPAAALCWLFVGGTAASQLTPRFDGFAKVRAKTIQSQLDQVEGDYLIALGDSHAERLYLPVLCGLNVLNAGISGATVQDVLALVRTVTPRRKARRILLVVGTNDIWSKRHPEDPGAEKAFAAGMRQLLDWLGAWTERVTLVAIPPVARAQEPEFPRAAAARYTALLREACLSGRCDVLPVFDAAGEGAAGRASGLSGDGVHLANYASHVRAAEAEICGGAPGLPTGQAARPPGSWLRGG
jgi:lysophospholipase L1-like esterase